jgi:hypothetical protein
MEESAGGRVVYDWSGNGDILTIYNGMDHVIEWECAGSWAGRQNSSGAGGIRFTVVKTIMCMY